MAATSAARRWSISMRTATVAIGYLEMHQGSPVDGALSTGNQPLMQYWAWPTDANGRPLPIDQFPVVAGIPQSMYDYLRRASGGRSHRCAARAGCRRSVAAVGFRADRLVLDPRTVGYDTLDLRRAGALTRRSSRRSS